MQGYNSRYAIDESTLDLSRCLRASATAVVASVSRLDWIREDEPKCVGSASARARRPEEAFYILRSRPCDLREFGRQRHVPSITFAEGKD